MIEPYFKPEAPFEPYFLLRAFDLGRIQEILRQLMNEAMDMTDIDEANKGANRVLDEVNKIMSILRENKPEEKEEL